MLGSMECADLLKGIGERIRTLRKARKVSQERLAELAGLHPIFLSNVETGKVRGSICTYQSIAEALGMSLAELTELPGEKNVWNSELMVLFQSAKNLSEDKQKIFVETVRGVLSGLGS